MRLIKLKIEPSGEKGWGSGELKFGNDITQLYGPNGSGKTPVIHSIAFALGYPVRFREDILQRCKSVILWASLSNKFLKFERELDTQFHIKCIVTEGKQETTDIFYNENDISQFLFNLIGLEIPVLTSIRNQPVNPFISTLLPLFYVDQDVGYTNAYSAPNNFIKDQYSEMIRFVLGVPVKNAFERKRLIIDKTSQLDSINGEIVSTEKFIEQLIPQRKFPDISVNELKENLIVLNGRLDEISFSKDASREINSTLQLLINEKQRTRDKINDSIRNIRDRISSYEKIKNEINIEINTLSLNEESRRVFSSFNDICSKDGCQLFLNSSESYGKNLLYLKDQIKDLERSYQYQEQRMNSLMVESAILTKDLEQLKNILNEEKNNVSTPNLVNTISELTRTIIDQQKELEISKRIQKEKDHFNSLLTQRNNIQNDIASMDNSGGIKDFRVIEFRILFKSKLIEWLDVLRTKNVSREISIDPDFNILFGKEKITQFSGSTLLRVVLAVKAAFFEIHISTKFPKIEFFILDTPRQQDIEAEHFGAYINKLKRLLSTVKRGQVIFSTTEYHYKPLEKDAEWIPTFVGEEQKMFLGISSS